MPEPSVIITQRGADRLRSGHLWVYRSDVRGASAAAGDIVRVSDERGRFLGRAFYSDKSQIAIRLLTAEDAPVDRSFFAERLRQAVAYRERVVQNADAYRLVHAEGDLLPSLIVDRYGDYLVLQTLSQGADRQKGVFLEILLEMLSPKGVLERNDPKVRALEALDQRTSVLHGEVPAEVVCRENGLAFAYDLRHGQKTGSFLDQRENRLAARQYASGSVLDCFSYQGGFALAIACACERVEAVEISAAAIQAARRNQELNGTTNVEFREANAFDLLKEYASAGRRFQMVILDPPAFAKRRDSLPAAARGYKEINLRAMKLLEPGGFLVTCSCSHHVSEAMLLQILAEAANDARRRILICERLTQARDHPILLTMAETMYLKCFILMFI